MTIIDEAKAYIRKEYEQGNTHEQIAKKYGVSSNHISNLLSGKRSFESMRLGTFLKLFPNTTLNVNGDMPMIHAPRNHGNVVGINKGTITDCMSAVIDKILADDTLSDAEKIKVIKVLKK